MDFDERSFHGVVVALIIIIVVAAVIELLAFIVRH
jgi:hypothetical protein